MIMAYASRFCWHAPPAAQKLFIRKRSVSELPGQHCGRFLAAGAGNHSQSRAADYAIDVTVGQFAQDAVRLDGTLLVFDNKSVCVFSIGITSESAVTVIDHHCPHALGPRRGKLILSKGSTQ